MKKRKIFKKITLGGLAVVMAGAGIFAFAPIGASASTPPPTTTTGLGLDPKNDPVVYTTESGLEIKMSNADKFSGTVTTTTNTGVNYTQDLSSFYYFTMGTFSGTIYTAKTQTDTYKVTNEPVNWIILGVGSHSNAFIDSVSNYLFSTIKNNDYLFSNGEYYFDNQHETYSPAGQLIDSTISAKTYIMGKVKDSIKVHTEIPKGCMLVLSEKLLGQMYFNGSGNINANLTTSTSYNYLRASNVYGGRYRYIGNTNTGKHSTQSWTTTNNAGGSLYNYINSLFSKNNSTGAIEGENKLGLTKAQADLIVPQQLYTVYHNLYETPETDGGTYYTMFPLTFRYAYSGTYQNFCVDDYFLYDGLGTPNSIRVATLIGSNQAYQWFLRDSYNSSSGDVFGRIVNVDGVYNSGGYLQGSLGVRPAMVMKLS